MKWQITYSTMALKTINTICKQNPEMHVHHLKMDTSHTIEITVEPEHVRKFIMLYTIEYSRRSHEKMLELYTGLKKLPTPGLGGSK